VNVVAWLERFAMLDELIDGKNVEIEQERERACGTVGSADGMPHAPGVFDKVGCRTVKLIALEEEKKRYEDQKNAMLDILQMLPAAEYGVLRREYVCYMTQAQIGADMGYCTVQVWRIKKRALKLLEAILKG
jgi:DNA-directed RNA polymerase specialized sigma24 family protein